MTFSFEGPQHECSVAASHDSLPLTSLWRTERRLTLYILVATKAVNHVAVFSSREQGERVTPNMRRSCTRHEDMQWGKGEGTVGSATQTLCDQRVGILLNVISSRVAFEGKILADSNDGVPSKYFHAPREDFECTDMYILSAPKRQSSPFLSQIVRRQSCFECNDPFPQLASHRITEGGKRKCSSVMQAQTVRPFSRPRSLCPTPALAIESPCIPSTARPRRL